MEYKRFRVVRLPCLVVVMLLHAQSVAAALVEFYPELDTPAPGIIVGFIKQAAAWHDPFFPRQVTRPENYLQGGTWEATSGSVMASVSAAFSESDNTQSIHQSLQVGVRGAEGINWGNAEAWAVDTVTFTPTQRLRYTLNANFSLHSEMDLDLDDYGWQVSLWEWRDYESVPLESFQNPVGEFSSVTSGFLEVGVAYGLSTDLFFRGQFDESAPIAASLVDGAGFADLQLTVVPLPAAAWLFGSAVLALGVIKRKST